MDHITGGGLPRGRATLLIGGPGSGKTVLALQTLVNGARLHQEPGIFVAFEENSRRVIANAATFGWNLPTLERKHLFFLDAQPSPDLLQAGNFDLQGLLAALDVKVAAMGARRIVFDSVDVLLSLLDDPRGERREMGRLHEWLLARDLTAVITAKAHPADLPRSDALGFVQFMVDCAVVLNHAVVDGVSQRSLRVMKYRGSGFAENQSPLVIGPSGIEVADLRPVRPIAPVGHDRISTGVERLDTMLSGGYFRGASILITGAPGTAKTTLAGAFVEAACRRGEGAVYLSFDSEADEIVRNLASVRLRLAPHVRQGRLHVVTARGSSDSAEVQLLRLKSLVRESRPRCLVVDPVSALSKSGNEGVAHSVVERLVDWAKSEGMTLLCTSLLAGAQPESESTPLQISTIADTWIHLSYVVHAGERNRALTIIKSRGTSHSNQVRELVLSDAGITLADVYTAEGQVLMGSLRWQKEAADRAEEDRRVSAARRRRRELELHQGELRDRIAALERELTHQQKDIKAVEAEESDRRRLLQAGESALHRRRGGDRRAPSPAD